MMGSAWALTKRIVQWYLGEQGGLGVVTQRNMVDKVNMTELWGTALAFQANVDGKPGSEFRHGGTLIFSSRNNVTACGAFSSVVEVEIECIKSRPDSRAACGAGRMRNAPD